MTEPLWVLLKKITSLNKIPFCWLDWWHHCYFLVSLLFSIVPAHYSSYPHLNQFHFSINLKRVSFCYLQPGLRHQLSYFLKITSRLCPVLMAGSESPWKHLSLLYFCCFSVRGLARERLSCRCTGLQLTANMGLGEVQKTGGKMAWSYLAFS